MIANIFNVALSAAAIAVICFSAPANAAKIKNLDAVAVKVVIVEGDARIEHLIASQQELTDVCASTCSIYVGNDTEAYDLLADDKMEIEDGQLFYAEEPPQPSTN